MANAVEAASWVAVVVAVASVAAAYPVFLPVDDAHCAGVQVVHEAWRVVAVEA